MDILAPALSQKSSTGPGPLSSLRQTLLDQLATAVALLSPSGMVLDCNGAALSLAACPRDSFLGKPFSQAFPFASSEAARQIEVALAGAVDSPVELDLILRPIQHGESPRVLRTTFRSLPAEGDRTASILVEAHDITAEIVHAHESACMLDSAQRERNRFRDLLSHSPAGIGLTFGPDHRWTFINEDYVRLTGRKSAADFLGKTVREAMPEIESRGFPALLDKVYRSGEPYYGREARPRVNHLDSGPPEEGYFDFLYQPMRNADGQIEGIFVFAVEVTNMVNARQAVEENAERLRLAQSAAQIGVWEWDPIRNSHTLSLELQRIFGTDESDSNQTATWSSRIHPADLSRVQLLMVEGHRLGTMEFEYRYFHPDLGQRWLLCKGHRRPAETRMFGIVQDITARKNAEVGAQRLAAIVESSDDAIVSKDLHSIVTSWNPGAERIFGYSADEMIGHPITKVIPPELYNDETRILSTIQRGERIEHFETVRVHKDGHLIDVSITVSPVKDESGRIIGAAKIARDITQQRKAERALRTTERLASVGRLAATVAHEINNPLEAVTNLIYLAKNAEDPAPYLNMAEEELERVSHLTRQTLGFYRETKTATNVRVGELAESLLAVFTPRIRNKSAHLTSEIRDDVEISAVPGEIRQVIANLISNSIDALAHNGKIRLRVTRATRRKNQPVPGIRLTIADNGSGISSEIREHLFEPFFTTKKDVGTGLGLWICKSIIENHNGTISVYSSTSPKRCGTVFSVFLPIAGEQAPNAAAQGLSALGPAIK